MSLEVAGETYPVQLDVVGESSIYALLAGIEVSRILGVRDERLRAFLGGTRAGVHESPAERA